MPKSRASQWIVTGVVAALVLALVIAGIALRRPIAVALGLDHTGGAATIAPTMFPSVDPSPTSAVEADLLPTAQPGAGGPMPSKESLSSKIAALDTSQLLTAEQQPASLAWEVLDPATGTTIASRNEQQMLIPASNTKMLTAVAAFSVFQGNERFETKVTSLEPGQLVLVGGGDGLLACEPVEDDVYPQTPSLRALAEDIAKVLRKEGITEVSLAYDASYFETSGWASTWPEDYRDQVTPVSALWCDEGKVDEVRQADPAAAAATRFATQLRESGITVKGEPTVGKSAGSTLASIQSLPVRTLAEQALQRSNNSFTEVLGLQLARKVGRPTTFAGSTAAIGEQLTKLGIWQENAHLDDASGLSRTNLVSAHMLALVIAHIVSDARLTGILNGMPVAGVTGTLQQRFTDDLARPARGIARAKTGSLSFVSTLAGTTTTADGAVVVYAIMAGGQENNWQAKLWEDQIVGVLTGCGC